MTTLPAAAAMPAPPNLAARARRRLLGIAERDTRPATRGFRVDDPAIEARLVRIGETFAAGYHAALLDPDPLRLADSLRGIEVGWRGFAFEGAGMGLALVDYLSPGRSSRLQAFLDGPGAPHGYLVVVGAGWTLARLPRRLGAFLRSLPPRLRWLSLDGYGFHHGYFGWRRAVVRQRVPSRLRGYGRHAFDQGLGRSLWFVEGARPEGIAAVVDGFPADRRGDLWSGVGLACAYAGGVAADGPEGLDGLRRLAGRHARDLAQGVTFAARARVEAADPAPQTDLACRTLCGLDAVGAARLTQELEPPTDAADRPLHLEPSYAVWRRRVARALVRKELS